MFHTEYIVILQTQLILNYLKEIQKLKMIVLTKDEYDKLMDEFNQGVNRIVNSSSTIPCTQSASEKDQINYVESSVLLNGVKPYKTN